jgi:HK97 gp10 family phage protein
VPRVAEIVHWKGFRELEQNLKMLGEEMREKGVKRMMSQAAVPMRDDATTRAPVLLKPDPRRRPGTLRNAISIWRKRKTPHAVTYYVGVRRLSGKKVSAFKRSTGREASENPDDPFYFHMVERGTSKMRAQPFLRPAFESKKLESVRVALETGREFVRAMKFKRVK